MAFGRAKLLGSHRSVSLVVLAPSQTVMGATAERRSPDQEGGGGRLGPGVHFQRMRGCGRRAAPQCREDREGEVDLLNEAFGFRILPLLEHGGAWGASLGHDLARGPGTGVRSGLSLL